MYFLLGRIKLSPRIAQHTKPWEILRLLDRHARGDWGHAGRYVLNANAAIIEAGKSFSGLCSHHHSSDTPVILLTETAGGVRVTKVWAAWEHTP